MAATTTNTRVQVDLRSGARHRTCWVEPKVKVGDRCTLKNSADPVELWDVLAVYRPVDAASINRGWENDI